MSTTMTMVNNHKITVTMYRDIEDDARIAKMVMEGAKPEDAEFIVVKNRLRRTIGEGAPQFFPGKKGEGDE
jgi:hypothetical protein